MNFYKIWTEKFVFFLLMSGSVAKITALEWLFGQNSIGL